MLRFLGLFPMRTASENSTMRGKRRRKKEKILAGVYRLDRKFCFFARLPAVLRKIACVFEELCGGQEEKIFASFAGKGEKVLSKFMPNLFKNNEFLV